MKVLFLALTLLLTACGSASDEVGSEPSAIAAFGTADVILEPALWTVTIRWGESEEPTDCEVPEVVEHEQSFQVAENLLREKSKELFYTYEDCRVDEEKRSVECWIGNNVETAYATCEPGKFQRVICSAWSGMCFLKSKSYNLKSSRRLTM